jgi:TolA-binding protein
MTIARTLLLLPLLAACGTLGIGSRSGGGGDEAARRQLWDQAFDAYSRDSVRVSQAIFQRLASDYPRSHEGHEARYYLGVLSLDPRGNLDVRAAGEHFGIYVADDSIRSLGGIHRREAITLRQLAADLRNPCGQRTSGVGCDTTVVSRTVTAPGEAPATGEAAALRRQLREKDQRIRELQAELERIRNTLAPRPATPRD